jgi:uncharacterized protein (UPF0548 family)
MDALDPELDALRRQELTYAEVGRTRGGVPAGYDRLRRTRDVGSGAGHFAAAAETLLGWDMHRRAGVPVRASSARAAVDSVAVLSLGRGPLVVRAPVRVVYVIEDDRRTGFAYGTLPGHPECGEEAFVLEHLEDGRVQFTITAFSRPASALATLGGPITGLVQRWVTNRYLHAV